MVHANYRYEPPVPVQSVKDTVVAHPQSELAPIPTGQCDVPRVIGSFHQPAYRVTYPLRYRIVQSRQIVGSGIGVFQRVLH